MGDECHIPVAMRMAVWLQATNHTIPHQFMNVPPRLLKNMKLFNILIILLISINAEAGINFALESITADKAMIGITQYGFRSLKEAEEFGKHWAGNKKIIKATEEEIKRLNTEIDIYIKINPDKRRDWEIKHIHRVGIQIGFFTVALSELKNVKNGANFYAGSIPCRNGLCSTDKN